MTNSCSSSCSNPCSTHSFQFSAGEDLDLYFHLTRINPSTGLVESLDLTPYATAPGSIQILLPGISTLQDADVQGLPEDGNIHLTFDNTLTDDAQTGFPIIILTDTAGKVRKVKSAWQIEKVG